MKKLEEYIRSIPDFPEKGIIFRDVTSILMDADGLKLAIDELAKCLEGMDFDVIAGAESRGFLFGMPLSYLLHKPFVPIRKRVSFLARLLRRRMILSTVPQQSRSTRMQLSRETRLFCSMI